MLMSPHIEQQAHSQICTLGSYNAGNSSSRCTQTCTRSSWATALSVCFFMPKKPFTLSAASTSFCRSLMILPATRHAMPCQRSHQGSSKTMGSGTCLAYMLSSIAQAAIERLQPGKFAVLRVIICAQQCKMLPPSLSAAACHIMCKGCSR